MLAKMCFFSYTSTLRDGVATSESVQYFIVADGAASKIHFVLVTRMYYNHNIFGGLCIKFNHPIMISASVV